jgi:formylglycine-generating enzyme required for sulfatase activity
MYYTLIMYNYSSVKIRTVWALVFCVFFAVMFSACGTKSSAVSNGDVVISKGGPGSPKNHNEPFKPLIEMVFVKGGTFQMGNPGNINRRRNRTEIPDNEWPSHEVTLNDFSIGKYEVTQEQYHEVTGLKPSNALKNPDDKSPDGWKKLPVESITWYDALVFCNMLSIKEKLRPVYSINGSFDPDDWGEPPLPFKKSAVWDTAVMDVKAEGYRLPTEAEWEYAARGGAESKGFNYAGSDTPEQVSWFSIIINKTPVGTIHGVGRKQPNELGLYDMSGNVLEWCWDWLGDYTENAQVNPVGPPRGLYRVIRGGGWSIKDFHGRVLFRLNNQPQYIGVNLGLRVARNN